MTSITTSKVAIPPPATDHTGPKYAAVIPDSKANFASFRVALEK
jgi:hypothetical protein